MIEVLALFASCWIEVGWVAGGGQTSEALFLDEVEIEFIQIQDGHNEHNLVCIPCDGEFHSLVVRARNDAGDTLNSYSAEIRRHEDCVKGSIEVIELREEWVAPAP